MTLKDLKYIWCLFLHEKHWKRTGERRIRRASISYKCICAKCGQDQEQVNWTIVYW